MRLWPSWSPEIVYTVSPVCVFHGQYKILVASLLTLEITTLVPEFVDVPPAMSLLYDVILVVKLVV